ncbi:MAG: ABC transporter permease subunit [Candidatus Aminicenantes bacterium]|nr:ABC transporter permease subunit [Candidatus Aminicenantes bacterium]
MIGTIVKREILDYLKSAKFQIGLVVTLVIAVVATAINIQDFKLRQQDYTAAREEMKGNKYEVLIYRPPQVLSVLVQGKDRVLGSKASLTTLTIPDRLTGYMGSRGAERQRSLSGFGSVDFAFVVRVILSLMVVFLAYNAVSEEKSFGTLKLALANPVPRHHLLLGKGLAGLAIVLGSLFIASTASVLLMLVQPFIVLAGSDVMRILNLVAASALYLIAFYALSLFVSVLVNRPSTALMILLQLWIILVVIYPHLGVDIAENFFRLPGDRELSAMKQAAFQPYEAEFNKVRDAYRYKGDRSPETGRRYFELQALESQKSHEVDLDFGRQLTRQMRLAQNLCLLSPAVLFDRMANRYARTGLDEYERFMQGLARYWQTKYLGLQKLRYEDLKAYQKAEVPAFDYPTERTAEAWIATIPQGLILCLMSLILFVLAYAAFLKKDVR